jgi:hypothetical protein
MSKNTIIKTIGLANKGQTYPVMKLVSDNPDMAALISKMVSNPATPTSYDNKGQRTIAQPNSYEFKNTSWRTARNANDARAVMQMFPDMELAAQILVSSILSPKDMMTTELIFQAPENVVSNQISGELLRIIRQHFDQVYKIKPMLGRILRDILFEKGSYICAVIPENSLDEIINRHTTITMEGISELIDKEGKVRSIGILGPSKKPNGAPDSVDPSPGVSLESFAQYDFRTAHRSIDGRLNMEGFKDGNTLQNPYLLVTDNPDVLKFPKIQKKLTEQRVNDSLKHIGNSLASRVNRNSSIALEAMARNRVTNQNKLTDRELTSAIYKNASNTHEGVALLKTDQQLKRKSVSNPLIMDLPSESVIPVHVPGQEEKHIGYFVLLDMNGNPINSVGDKDYYGELTERMNGGGNSSSFPSQLLNRIKSMHSGFDCTNKEHLDYSTRVYADMIEQDLIARLKNGIYTNGVQLARNEEVYRIMLARTFSRQQTQMLFLPVELVTYYAFRYTADGIGKSLMDDMKVLNSLRATTMFANVMASIRNSVAQTNVKLKLDEHDPDPYKSIERMMNEIVRAKQQSFPLGANSPVDIVNWLQRAGYQWAFEGHPGLPDIQVEFSESSTNYPKPDSELEESLRKRAIMSTGLNPETVDNGFSGEFATSVVANNVLLSRRVMQIQEQFCPLLNDNIQKIILATPSLLDNMRSVIENGYNSIKLEDDQRKRICSGLADEKSAIIDYVLLEWIHGMETQLPRPNSVTLENQFQAYETYSKILDQLLDAWINESFFTAETGGDVAQHVTTMRNAVRAHFIRKWSAENGVMPELSDITAMTEEGSAQTNFWEIQQSHMGSLMKTMSEFLKSLQPAKDKSDAVLANSTDMAEAPEQSMNSNTDSSSGADGLDTDLDNNDLDNTEIFDDSDQTSDLESTVSDSSIDVTTDTDDEVPKEDSDAILPVGDVKTESLKEESQNTSSGGKKIKSITPTYVYKPKRT